MSSVTITYLTLRTAHSPDALLGRIGSTARTISLGLQPVGMLAGGLLIDATNGATTIVAMGVLVAVLALVFAPIGALRRASTDATGGVLGGDGDRVEFVPGDLDDDVAVRALDARRVQAVHGNLGLAPGAFDVDHGRSLTARRDS